VAKELGILVVNVPAYSPEAGMSDTHLRNISALTWLLPVAEFAVGMLLTIVRK
jgi:lactate dehydrogenase-like 2-hydroxyacid dehydrogenase